MSVGDLVLSLLTQRNHLRRQEHNRAVYVPCLSWPWSWVKNAVGRAAAEQITPYPPGIPVVVPGEGINTAIIDYLESGLKAGMVLPDPADPSLQTIRAVRR